MLFRFTLTMPSFEWWTQGSALIRLLNAVGHFDVYYVRYLFNDFYIVFSETWSCPSRPNSLDFRDSCRLIAGVWGRTPGTERTDIFWDWVGCQTLARRATDLHRRIWIVCSLASGWTDCGDMNWLTWFSGKQVSHHDHVHSMHLMIIV